MAHESVRCSAPMIGDVRGGVEDPPRLVQGSSTLASDPEAYSVGNFTALLL
jgi:hypothetical protein